MTDLTGFLLARIAEDEEDTRQQMGEMEKWPLADNLPGGPTTPSVVHVAGVTFVHPRRVLAECEAKRRIVEEAFIVQAGSTEVVYIAENGRQGRRRALYPSALEMLKALAAVYSDHPDFDPAWRETSPGDDDGRWDDDGGRQ